MAEKPAIANGLVIRGYPFSQKKWTTRRSSLGLKFHHVRLTYIGHEPYEWSVALTDKRNDIYVEALREATRWIKCTPSYNRRRLNLAGGLHYAVAGSAGVGKSTLVRLLCACECLVGECDSSNDEEIHYGSDPKVRASKFKINDNAFVWEIPGAERTPRESCYDNHRLSAFDVLIIVYDNVVFDAAWRLAQHARAWHQRAIFVRTKADEDVAQLMQEDGRDISEDEAILLARFKIEDDFRLHMGEEHKLFIISAECHLQDGSMKFDEQELIKYLPK